VTGLRSDEFLPLASRMRVRLPIERALPRGPPGTACAMLCSRLEPHPDAKEVVATKQSERAALQQAAEVGIVIAAFCRVEGLRTPPALP
jgi:hypothetical protein